jgi:hypothetical protein
LGWKIIKRDCEKRKQKLNKKWKKNIKKSCKNWDENCKLGSSCVNISSYSDSWVNIRI